MSWDVFVQDLPEGSSVGEVPDDFEPQPLGPREKIVAAIRDVWPDVDFADPAWGIVEAEGYSIEVGLGPAPVVSSIALHVRGGDEAEAAVLTFLRRARLRAIDGATGRFLPADGPTGLREWRAHLDRIMSHGG